MRKQHTAGHSSPQNTSLECPALRLRLMLKSVRKSSASRYIYIYIVAVLVWLCRQDGRIHKLFNVALHEIRWMVRMPHREMRLRTTRQINNLNCASRCRKFAKSNNACSVKIYLSEFESTSFLRLSNVCLLALMYWKIYFNLNYLKKQMCIHW